MTDQQDIEEVFDDPKAACPTVSASQAPAGGNAGVAPSGSIGARLRGTRGSKGLTLADCGRDLHLPVKVLQRLEDEDFGPPEDFVFLRGALTGYARYLGLPPDSCDAALRAAAPAAQPELVAVARTSNVRWLLQRYGTAATYIVLTALIAVPLVLLGLRGGLHRPITRIVSLDHAAVTAPTPGASSPVAGARATTPSPDAAPFRASIAPFAAIDLGDDAGLAGADAADAGTRGPAANAGQHTLGVSASSDCWFEITDADGNRIDSGMLHAGDSRTWHAQGLLHVTLGNADGVSVTRDGQPLPLDAFQHANVARFDVFGAPGASEND